MNRVLRASLMGRYNRVLTHGRTFSSSFNYKSRINENFNKSSRVFVSFAMFTTTAAICCSAALAQSNTASDGLEEGENSVKGTIYYTYI